MRVMGNIRMGICTAIDRLYVRLLRSNLLGEVRYLKWPLILTIVLPFAAYASEAKTGHIHASGMGWQVDTRCMEWIDFLPCVRTQ